MRISKISSAAVAAGVFMAAGAMAQPIVEAGYQDLSGNWNGALFTAFATAQPGLNSSGSVARLVSPIGTAAFEPGFVAGANPADFSLALSFIPGGPGFGLGFGSFSITDADGSTMTGNINGTWLDNISSVTFLGSLSGVTFSGATFDGTAGGSFSTLFGGSPPYDGAITQIFLTPPGNFFTSPFSDVNTGVTMQILPAPGAMALMGLGGLIVGRRRR